MKDCSAIKKNDLVKFTGNWMEQLQKQNKTKNIQSEVPQTLKDKNGMYLIICRYQM